MPQAVQEASRVYTGKTKDVFEPAPGSDRLLFRFTDRLLGRDGIEDTGGNTVVGSRAGKSVHAAALALAGFEALRRTGIPTHFIEADGADAVWVARAVPIRLELIARNLAWGGYLRRHSEVEPLAPLNRMQEITMKDDIRDDPLISAETAVALKICAADELRVALDLLERVRACLTEWYTSFGLRLADLKMEVGLVPGGLAVIDDPGYDNIRVFDGARLLRHDELFARVIHKPFTTEDTEATEKPKTIRGNDNVASDLLRDLRGLRG